MIDPLNIIMQKVALASIVKVLVEDYKMSNEIKITGQNEGEDCDYVVCIPISDPLVFPDNLIGECYKCKQPIQFRPHAPKAPARVCFSCIKPDLDKASERENLHVMITVKTAEEVSDFLRKKTAN